MHASIVKPSRFGRVDLELSALFWNTSAVSERKEPFDESVWRAYGPQKEAWKKAGNYFTAEELERMEAELSDLTIQPIPRKVYEAD